MLAFGNPRTRLDDYNDDYNTCLPLNRDLLSEYLFLRITLLLRSCWTLG